jgi:hypothetical protein
MDDDFTKLLHEVSGMRLVLVHLLRQMPPIEIGAIAESINQEIAKMDEHGLAAERAMIPYREAADDILAHALRLQRESED